MKYAATDDFGIGKLVARVQVDDHEPEVFQLPLDASNPQNQAGVWNLSVAEQLQRKGVTSARRITYELKAFDNCEPTRQSAATAKYVLEVDDSVASLADRESEQAARDLTEAINQARHKLDAAESKIDSLRPHDASRPLDPNDLAQAREAQQNLTDAAKQLTQAAKPQAEGAFKDASQAAQKIADEPVKNAADDMAKTQLATDQPAAQHENLNDAKKQIADARQQLDALEKQIGQTAADQRLEHRIDDLAKKQNDVADKLAAAERRDPAAAQQAREEQKQLQQQTEQLIRENPQMQGPVDKSLQPKAQDLAQKLQDLENQQKPLTDQTQKRANDAEAASKTDDLAKQQEKLNQDIRDFNGQQQQAMQEAKTPPPETKNLDDVTKDLQTKKLENAEQQ